MKKILYYTIAAILLLSSCSREDDNLITPNAEEETMTFTATYGDFDNETRTALKDSYKVVWTSGDEIAVNGKKFIVSNISADGKTATFTGPSAGEPPYKAVYPYESFDSISTDGRLYLHVQKEQTYQENSFGNGALPMHVISNSTTLNFSTMANVLKLQLKGNKKISKIVIDSGGGPATSSIDLSYYANTTLDCSADGGVQLNESISTNFYLVAPTSKYSIIFVDTDGHLMIKTISNISYSLGGKIVTMPELTYTPDEYGKHEIYQTHTKGKGIDIFISGDGYTKAQNEDASIVKARFTQLAEGFFYLSPLKELRDYFNVHFVYAKSNTEYTDDNTETSSNTIFGVYQDDRAFSMPSTTKCLNFIWNSTGIDPTGKVTIVDVKRKTYGRSATYMFGDDNTAIAMCYNEAEANYIVSHEASGHGFGKLADEYIEVSAYGETAPETFTNSMKENHKDNWSMNVDGESDPNKIVWAKFLQDTRYNDENLGVYEGAHYYRYGAYRPAQTSIMVNSLAAGFNAPSREAIYKWVMSQAFDNWTYNYETFVTFDMARSRSIPHATRSTNYVEINPSERTAPPIIIEGSWKDYRDK